MGEDLLKTFGLLFLSAVPVLFSFFLGEEIRQKQNMRKNLLLLFQHILFQIENFNRDQKDIFSSFENKDFEKSGFLSDLCNEVSLLPCGAFHRTVEKHLSSFGFSAPMQDLILTAAINFGTQGKESQIKELRNLVEILEKEYEKEKTETENKIRITRMVGLTIGIGIFILML